MSTALAQDTTTVFIAECADQVLTRRPVRFVPTGEGGEKQELGEAEWIARQEDLNFQRLQKGEEPLPIDRTPWKVKFENYRFEVPADLEEDARERLVDWLRSHPRFNLPGPSGFYEQGKAPDEPRPTLTEQMTEISAASAAGEEDRIEAALSLERETHNREAVIAAAEAGLAGLRKLAELAAGAELGDPGEPQPADDQT